MTTELRETGISVVGGIPWGAHFCYFYGTKQDQLDVLIPYFKVGLENNEFCLWVISAPLTGEEAINALRQAVPDLERHLAERNIEVLYHDEWYFKEGVFELSRVISGWDEKLNEALARGFEGMRVSGDTGWIRKDSRGDFSEYEQELAVRLEDKRMIVLCAYPLADHAAAEVLDVARNHQFAIARRDGSWDVLEAPDLSQARREIKRLNEELEQRVLERTEELAAANEELRREIGERKRVEEALKESQRRLEEAQRIAHVGHYEHDLDTGVIVMSDENYRILGLQPQESITLSRAFESIHPDDRERLHQARAEAVRTGQSFDVEYRFVRPDGEVRYVHSHTDLIRDEQGRIRRTFGIAQDITERMRVEEALRQAEGKYHGIFEHAIEGIFQTTPDGQYVTANPALARMLGYDSPQELIGSRTDIERQQYVEPERRSDFKRLLEENSIVQGFEYQAYRKDGSKIWLSESGRAVRDEGGAILYYEGFTEDITERKLAEEELKKEKEILKKIFDNVPVLIGFVGEDGRVKLVNPEWERIMGWTLKELQEQDVDIFAEAYPDLSYRQNVLDFVAASTGEWADLKIKVRDGRVIDAACAVVHLSDGTKVAIAQDITGRKLAEGMLQTFSQRLVETQEAERRRVARELHDEIGQALTAIKINLQAVQHSAGDSPLARQLNESAGIVDRALQQVRDLSFNLRPSLLDDLGLVAALRWYVDSEARRADLISAFVVDLKEARLPPELETACFRITQEALTNVVRHARATRIWVELRQRGAELHLTIRDDGIGFEVDAASRRRASDAGLGLQGMQERALILNGKIEIKSAPARGTEIHVRFPLPVAVSPAAKNEVE